MLVKLECGYPERGDKCRYRCLAISRKRYKTGMQILDGTQIGSRMWSTRNGFISMTFNWVIHSDPKPPQFIILASPVASLAQCVPGAIPVIPPLLHLLLYLLVSFTFPLFPFLLASSVFLLFHPFPRIQAWGRRRRPNLVFSLFLCYDYVICIA